MQKHLPLGRADWVQCPVSTGPQDRSTSFLTSMGWSHFVYLYPSLIHSSFSFNKYFLYNYCTFIEKPYHFRSFKEVKRQQNKKRKFLMGNILVLKFVHLPRSSRGENNLWSVEFPFDSLTPFIIMRSLHPLLQGKSRWNSIKMNLSPFDLNINWWVRTLN